MSETVLITGGASGIGAAFARFFLSEGAHVWIADRSERAIQSFRDSLGLVSTPTNLPDNLHTQQLDVRDQAAVQAWIQEAIHTSNQLGRKIDWFFNVAGTGVGGEALEYGPDDWRYVIEVNLIGMTHCIHAIYPHLVQQKYGRIVNVASMSGIMPSPFTAAYGAAKHGVVGLSRSLRAEAQFYGVQVMVVCPGVIDTPILVNAGEFGRYTSPVRPATQLAMMRKMRPMPADVFVKKAIKPLRRNRDLVVIPFWWASIWWINRLWPALGDWLAARAFLTMKRATEADLREQGQEKGS